MGRLIFYRRPDVVRPLELVDRRALVETSSADLAFRYWTSNRADIARIAR